MSIKASAQLRARQATQSKSSHKIYCTLTVLNSNQIGCVHLFLLSIVTSSYIHVHCILDNINDIVCIFILCYLIFSVTIGGLYTVTSHSGFN